MTSNPTAFAVIDADDAKKMPTRSVSVCNLEPERIPRDMENHLREWDILTNTSSSPSVANFSAHDEDFEQHDTENANMLEEKLQRIRCGTLSPPALPAEPDPKIEANSLDEWSHIINRGASPSLASVSEVTDLSGISSSSNAIDPIYFPSRGATPTQMRPHRAPIVRHGVLCQLCSEEIRGMRWMCKECPQWSVCMACFEVTAENEVHPIHTFIQVYSPTDIITVQRVPAAEIGRDSSDFDKANCIISQPIIHLDVQCCNCSGSIIGSRYDCAVGICRDNAISFCQDCEALPINCHPPSHPLIKFKVPKENCRPAGYYWRGFGQAKSLADDDPDEDVEEEEDDIAIVASSWPKNFTNRLAFRKGLGFREEADMFKMFETRPTAASEQHENIQQAKRHKGKERPPTLSVIQERSKARARDHWMMAADSQSEDQGAAEAAEEDRNTLRELHNALTLVS